MTYSQRTAIFLVVLASLVAPIAPAYAAIDTQNLGAKYDDTNTNITFRTYSSRATPWSSTSSRSVTVPRRSRSTS